VATLKKYDLTGKEIGNVQIDDEIVNAEANGQMIKDYIVALRNNARQWSACTKTRSEVNHSTKKPHPQKGGGRARQGQLSAPQYKGGGRVFAPRPKFDQHVRINKKERKAAIRSLLAEKLRDNKVVIIDNYNLKAPKTKDVVNFMTNCNISGRVLFLREGNYEEFSIGDVTTRISIQDNKHDHFARSVRNIPKVGFAMAANVSGYDVLVAHHIVMTQAALNELNQLLK